MSKNTVFTLASIFLGSLGIAGLLCLVVAEIQQWENIQSWSDIGDREEDEEVPEKRRCNGSGEHERESLLSQQEGDDCEVVVRCCFRHQLEGLGEKILHWGLGLTSLNE